MNHKDLNEISGILLDVAARADAEGFCKEADAIASVLPSLKIMKAAQYEGFHHYWIHNGRAFEKAFVEKMRGKGKHFDLYDAKSAQDTWFEVLEEYQDGLMGNEADFISKYASKAKEVEEAACSGGSSGGTTMSKEMTEFRKKLKNKADEEGVSEGRAISEWLDNHKAACDLLMKKVAAKVEKGEPAGVAFYSAMDEFSSGQWLNEALASIRSALDGVRMAAIAAREKDPTRTEALDGLEKKAGAGDWWDKAKDWYSGNFEYQNAPTFKAIQEARKIVPGVERQVNKFIQMVGGGAALDPAHLQSAAAPLLKPVKTFFDSMMAAGMAPPAFPDPTDSRYHNQQNKIDASGFGQWLGDFKKSLQLMNPQVALQVEKSRGTGSPVTAPTKKAPSDLEEKYMEKQVTDMFTVLGMPPPLAASIIGKPGSKNPNDLFGMIAGFIPQLRDPSQVAYVTKMVSSELYKALAANGINANDQRAKRLWPNIEHAVGELVSKMFRLANPNMAQPVAKTP